ncbi:pyruvate dehydrogenase protein X component, mitochondrial [Galendromus occidentalis]|uniref:Dihydrolipoamide acetyltransferase component of pyruvate dehydrogenase complex n=1 Tax=Galendromus occidentalis TaxID=34638 RepID=A0AAJ6QVV9_9ACAR|nr:pyruvate dehydrogenase protein X component, mitochondrial [Galendromus occidentalis]
MVVGMFGPAVRAALRGSKVFAPNARCIHRTRIVLGIDGIQLRMPSLSPTMTEGVIVRWMKNEGDAIQPGDVLCEIQTDKAVVAFEVEEPGTLAKIIAPSGDQSIPINTLIGIMVEEGEDWKDVNIPADTAPPAAAQSSAPGPPTAASPAPVPRATPVAQSPSSSANLNLLGPAVKLLLSQNNLQASQVPATGPHNVLLKGDVLRFIESGGAAALSKAAQTGISATQQAKGPSAEVGPPPEPAYKDIELTNMRRAIAKRLSLSKSTVPHSYTSYEVSVGKVLQTRKKLAEMNVKVSVNDFVVKAVALALRKVPQINVTWDSQSQDGKQQEKVDISVAVSTDSGLITPIVKDADQRSLSEISNSIKELATKARENKLKPHEFEGGSFSVSNLGMFGITEFTAVINPPQAAIMAVGGGRQVFTSARTVDTLMTVTVSFDARLMSDTDVAEFLEAFREYMEEPEKMMT